MVYDKKNNIARFRQMDENGCYKFNYNKESIRTRMVDRVSIPCLKTAVKYGFTEEDLKPVMDRYYEILKSGIIPSNTFQKVYKKKKDVDVMSDITESDLDTESDCGYSTDSSFF
jgi:hypothetical protein